MASETARPILTMSMTIEPVSPTGTSSTFTYDSMERLTKIRVHRVDEYQETLYTYDHRGLVKTEVNAKGDGKVFVYDGNGNLIQKTDEDGYVTEYRGEKGEKLDNPNKPEEPDNPGSEDNTDKQVNKANKELINTPTMS